MSEKTTVVRAVVLDEDMTIGAGQLCESLGLDLSELVACVQEGFVEPFGDSPDTWSFPGPALKRLHTLLRLRRGLNIDLAGAVLAVELLEDITHLRERVHALEELLRGTS